MSKTIKIEAKEHDLGGGMTIHRVLPFRNKRMVGPFCFLDHMGPVKIQPGQNTDVRPHPHIGLSTLTYLFGGRIVHRDSVGSVAVIQPGEVNWMIAGSGISHSERAHDEDRKTSTSLHGLQFWVALPEDQEDVEPSFHHYGRESIPRREVDDYSVTLVAGEAFGMKSKVNVTSPLVFADFVAKRDFRFEAPAREDFELAIYVVSGEIFASNESLKAHEMLCFDINCSLSNILVKQGTRFVVIGGKPFPTPRHMWWNLVSTSKDKIEAAKRRWKDRSFPQVPGELEYIPLPD